MADSEYHGGDYIFTKAGEIISESVRLHEISHQLLMKSTHWGIMTYHQAQFRRADRSQARLDNNIKIGNLLMQAAETVFESHAVFNQLLYAKYNNEDEFKSLLLTPYYKLYKQKYFDSFLTLDLPLEEVAYLSQKLPNLALATDLLDVPPECWRSKDSLMNVIMSDEKKYNPDVRFRYLIDAYMRLLCKYRPDQITNSMIAEESNIYIKISEYTTPMQFFLKFSDFMKQVYDTDELDKILELMEKSLVEGEVDDIVNEAESLDIPLPQNDLETINVQKIEPWLNECQVLKLIPFNEYVYLEYHATEFHKRYLLACNWDALPIFYAKYNKTILLYSEDYYYMKEKFPYLKNRRVFYYFEGGYKSFCEHIKDKTEKKPPVFLYKINDSTFCIFVKGQKNEIIFTGQNMGGIKLFVEDIQKDIYQYINLENSKTDEIFYINDSDWAIYDDVVKSVLHVRHTSGRCELL